MITTKQKILACEPFGIKPLAESISKKNFIYTLVKRDKFQCLYAQHHPAGFISSYEVFPVKLIDRHVVAARFNREIEGPKYAESYPSDDMLGSSKFSGSFSSMDKAEVFYQELQELLAT